MKKWTLVLLLFIGLGCLEVENDLKLKKDLSGKTSFSIQYDMTMMVQMMSSMGDAFKKGMKKKKQEKSPEQLKREAREKFLKEGFQLPSSDDLETFRKECPRGVTPEKIRFVQDGMKLKIFFQFAFEDVRLLSKLDLSQAMPSQKKKGGGAMKIPFFNPDNPFAGFQVIENEKILTIKVPMAMNKSSKGRKMGNMPPGMMKGFGFKYRFDLPFPIVKHNADKIKGQVLEWNYDMQKLENLPKEGGGVYVEMKRE